MFLYNYKSFLGGEMWAFHIYQEMMITTAMTNCVNRKTICNIYSGKALDDYIQNATEDDEDKEERETIVALLCLSYWSWAGTTRRATIQ